MLGALHVVFVAVAQLATVRVWPQLSAAVSDPQFRPYDWQNCESLSQVQHRLLVQTCPAAAQVVIVAIPQSTVRL
jgi:hypothetical protein